MNWLDSVIELGLSPCAVDAWPDAPKTLGGFVGRRYAGPLNDVEVVRVSESSEGPAVAVFRFKLACRCQLGCCSYEIVRTAYFGHVHDETLSAVRAFFFAEIDKQLRGDMGEA